ncbi:hypothetical protein EOW77_0009180 [Bradyrhizobium yuanmingense]|uniref:hypothetical protein n=1 Tax=Bradyrhizobium yuanmingense TaxID=108015 RepID=UPI000FE35FDD|nr:hypothetical protein [Bradyrhizobium yuanmingense]TGN88999.1 hypothetical protein EOW77_0009180 [Bradyrhizobium yuanmingense]
MQTAQILKREHELMIAAVQLTESCGCKAAISAIGIFERITSPVVTDVLRRAFARREICSICPAWAHHPLDYIAIT